jgi:two-component system OmpR family response regulator
MPNVHILVVDDDPEVRILLRRCFELEGYQVGEAATGSEVLAYIAGNTVDLITLDLGLGGEDGLELARKIRARQNVAVVMVTGKDDPIDRVVGLELGADDYITKPFHLREVLARVRAVLRRYSASRGPRTEPDGSGTGARPAAALRFAFAGFILDPAKRELVDGEGRPVPLTTAEYNLLLMFAERPTRVLSRDNIMDLLKGHEWSPFDRSIDTLVGRLRKKIEADVERPQIIKTVRGVGYVMASEVRKQS